jgi:hypothetical protein
MRVLRQGDGAIMEPPVRLGLIEVNIISGAPHKNAA